MDPIIGGALGGLTRLAPEVLGFFDRKARRKHELALLAAGRTGEQIRADGEFRSKALDALNSAISTQGQITGNKWADGINALIRPIITIQWVILLYPLALALQWTAIFSGSGGNLASAVEATRAVFGPEERALCSFIVNFWFLGRVLDKARAS